MGRRRRILILDILSLDVSIGSGQARERLSLDGGYDAPTRSVMCCNLSQSQSAVTMSLTPRMKWL